MLRCSHVVRIVAPWFSGTRSPGSHEWHAGSAGRLTQCRGGADAAGQAASCDQQEAGESTRTAVGREVPPFEPSTRTTRTTAPNNRPGALRRELRDGRPPMHFGSMTGGGPRRMIEALRMRFVCTGVFFVTAPALAEANVLVRDIRVQNLLSFSAQGVHLETGPLSVLVGPNGSGKSNLLEAVALMRSAAGDLPGEIRRGGARGSGSASWFPAIWQLAVFWSAILHRTSSSAMFWRFGPTARAFRSPGNASKAMVRLRIERSRFTMTCMMARPRSALRGGNDGLQTGPWIENVPSSRSAAIPSCIPRSPTSPIPTARSGFTANGRSGGTRCSGSRSEPTCGTTGWRRISRTWDCS